MNPAHLKIEEANIGTMLAQPGDMCLASGMAGALLLQAHLYSQAPTAARGARIAAAIAALVDAVQSRDLPVTLWTGLVGILYAFEYTRSVDPGLLPAPVGAFVADMDKLLAGFVTQGGTSLKFDLISGVAGIGAYALMRTDLAAARRLYSSVETTLIEQSDSTPSGRVWRTAPQFLGPLAPAAARLHGHIDLGVAHGQPGIVLLLAGALRHGIATERTATYLRQAAAALVGLQGEPVDGARYPYYTSQPGGSRLAWCYGDLSAGFALHAAAAVLDDSNLLATAHAIVRDRLVQPEDSFGLSDAALCHGHAGVLHLVGKMARNRPGAAYTQCTEARRAALGTGADGYACQPGFLEGNGGVLMALHDGPARGRHHWDACLCMGF